MTHDEDAKRRFDAVKAAAARGKQAEAERLQQKDRERAAFERHMDAIFDPIFHAKGAALNSVDHPVKVAPRALFYGDHTLYYQPLWDQTLTIIGTHLLASHEQEHTRGNYVHLALSRWVLDRRAMRRVQSTRRSVDLRLIAQSEPLWGRMARYERVGSSGVPTEGHIREIRWTDFVIEPIPQSTHALVQDWLEAMIRDAFS